MARVWTNRVEAVRRHKNFVHRCCCTRERKIVWKNSSSSRERERGRGTSFYFATSVFLFGWTTRSANDRCTRRKYKNGNVETLNVCIIVVATSEFSRPMKYEFVIGNTLKAIVEFVIHEMVCAPLSCLPRYSFGLNYTLVSRCVFIETWHIEIGGVE